LALSFDLGPRLAVVQAGAVSDEPDSSLGGTFGHVCRKGVPMVRRIAQVLPAILACAGFAQAQYDYSYPAAAPSDPRLMVKGWYEHYLGREPDPGALVWVNSLQKGCAPEQVLSTILSSQEYLLRAGGTRPAFLRQLYLDITGRPVTDQEFAYWMGRMRFDSRKDVAYQVLVFFGQNGAGAPGPAMPFHPGYYPEPTGAPTVNPAAPYFRDRSYHSYEYRRPVRTK
jgi:hypothetical protein